MIEDLAKEGDLLQVTSASGEIYQSRAVVITTGTFLNGLMHIGEKKIVGGRVDEPPSVGLSNALRKLGF